MDKEKLLQKVYLTRKDIQRLFGVSRNAGCRIFDAAMKIDDEELNFRPWPNRVRQKSVLRVQKITFAEMERHIKSAQSLAGQSTTAD